MNILIASIGFILMLCAGASDGPFFPIINIILAGFGAFLFIKFGNRIAE